MKKCYPFSQFSDIFGAAGTGPHSIRFMGVAIVDFALTIVLAMFVTWQFKVPLDLSIIAMLILALVFHWLFGVETGALKYLGLTCK
jgi:hypothetical protein